MEKTNKELRYDLLQAVRYDVDHAKKCYDFVQNENKTNADQQDGIYLIYDDGHAEAFTGENYGPECVERIGVRFQGHSFALSLCDEEKKLALLPEDKKPTERPEAYKNEVEAIYDFDSEGNTARLAEDSPAVKEFVDGGDAIPALGVLVIMRLLRDKINEALAYVGGQPLKKEGWYWSSTEYSTDSAWIVIFSGGIAYNYSKCYSGYVRAVAAF